MSLTCPRCQGTDVIARGNTANQCKRCKLVFDAMLLPAKAWKGTAALARGEPELIQAPAGMEALVRRAAASTTAYRGEKSATIDLDLTVILRWQRTSAYPATNLALIAFMLTLAAGFLFFVQTRQGTNPEIGAVCVAVLVIVLYVLIAVLVNRTSIEVKNGRVVVQHGPVPSWGNRDLDAWKIEQLFCDVSPGMKGAAPSFNVKVLLRDGGSTTLVAGLRDPDQALFIERNVERVLGLVDRPIEGELAYRGPTNPDA